MNVTSTWNPIRNEKPVYEEPIVMETTLEDLKKYGVPAAAMMERGATEITVVYTNAKNPGIATWSVKE